MKLRSAWRDQAEMLVPPLPWDRPRWREGGSPRVILLHGLWRGVRAMEPLSRHLHSEGFSTLNLPYPSARLPIDVLVLQIRTAVEKIAGDLPVHFVGHSLGAILARLVIADTPPWSPGRLVMLAPPNGGSEIVDKLAGNPFTRRILGPAGSSLGTGDLPARLPPLAPGTDAAVIMGKRSVFPWFRDLLDPQNDGIVSARRGLIDGLRGFSVIDADHTFIQTHPETLRLIPPFLANGNWPG